MATVGLSHTVSEINGDFSKKNRKIFSPRVFCAPAEGVPLGIFGTRYWHRGSKNQNDGATGSRRKFDDIFSRGGYNPPT